MPIKPKLVVDIIIFNQITKKCKFAATAMSVGSGEFQNLSKCFEIEDLVQGSLLLASRLIPI